MNENISQLIEFLKRVSPYIWKSLIQQVYSDAIVLATWAALFCINAMVFLFLTRRWAKKEAEGDDYTFWQSRVYFGCFVTIASTLVFILLAQSAFQRIYNPEFYAIAYIVGSLK